MSPEPVHAERGRYLHPFIIFCIIPHSRKKSKPFCKKNTQFIFAAAPHLHFFPVCRIHCTKTAEITGGKCYAKKGTACTHRASQSDSGGSFQLTLTGVTDVDCFDERMINLFTGLGELTIKGRNLHINDVSVETGDMTITGDIWLLQYGEKDRRGPLSLLGKLFR